MNGRSSRRVVGPLLLLGALAVGCTGGLLLGALAVGCTGGLLLGANDYPCDFGAPPTERDKACAASEVCAPNGKCQKLDPKEAYSGVETTPTFKPVALQPNGAPVHKKVVGLAGPYSVGADEGMVAAYDDGTLARLKRGRVDAVNGVPEPLMAQLEDPDSGQPLLLEGDATRLALVGPQNTYPVQLLDGGEVTNAHVLRTVPVKKGQPPVAVVLRSTRPVAIAAGVPDEAGAVGQDPSGAVVYLPTALTVDGGTEVVRDVRFVSSSLFSPGAALNKDLVSLAVAADGIFAQPFGAPDAGWSRLDVPLDPVVAGLSAAQLEHSDDGTVWALRQYLPNQDKLPDKLVTLRRDVGADGSPLLVRAWSDCLPCGPGESLVAFTPRRSDDLSVEVLCGKAGVATNAARVIGGPAWGLNCQREPLELPMAPERVTAVDDSAPAKLALGGSRGELWDGTLLSQLLPLFLDRAPLAVGTLSEGGGAGFLSGGTEALALTPNYAAVETPVGFMAVPTQSLLAGAYRKLIPEAYVEGAPGMFVLSNGQLVTLHQKSGLLFSADFGARLVTPSGEAVGSPFFAESFLLDGKQAVLATGADGLFLVEDVQNASDRSVLPSLVPQPSFPIRGLALDPTRSPSADGSTVAQGYLVTSTDVFSFSYGGSPRKWTLTKLPLAFGEPLAVWMHAGTGFGRVGFRDGSVYALPSGILLAHAAEDSPMQVFDYAELGGWPMALTDQGVFGALCADCGDALGKDERYHLYAWQKALAVSDVRPDLAQGFAAGKLFAVPLRTGGEVLYVFLSDGSAYEVGRTRP